MRIALGDISFLYELLQEYVAKFSAATMMG